MTCFSFNRFQLYRDFDKFLNMKNGHYLAAILEVFSDNADPTRYLPSDPDSRFCL